MVRSISTRLGLACLLVAAAIQPGAASSTAGETPIARAEFIDRFLAPDHDPLVSYRAFRRLTASTRGGKMSASMEAWTTLESGTGFTYGITAREGSGLIRGGCSSRRSTPNAMPSRPRTATSDWLLTPANYEFLDINPEDERLIKMDVRPKRKSV